MILLVLETSLSKDTQCYFQNLQNIYTVISLSLLLPFYKVIN